MTLRYLEVTTVECDTCETTADSVQHTDYDPHELEYQYFMESLEEKGWILSNENEKTVCPKCKGVKKNE